MPEAGSEEQTSRSSSGSPVSSADIDRILVDLSRYLSAELEVNLRQLERLTGMDNLLLRFLIL